MYLGIILACMSVDNAATCVPVPNTGRLYGSIEECYTDAEQQAMILTQQSNLNTAVFCYETNFFEEV
jgi:hypothetical protein